MNKVKILFILHNIYESTNGVSNKYINFINYLTKLSYEVVLITTFKNKDTMNNILNENLKIIKVKGLIIPFYQEIKIPTLNFDKINEIIEYGNEIIIFNGEFIWLYDTLKNIKTKYKNIKLYPTMHTDYEYYINNIYKKYNFLSNLSQINQFNHLNNYLEKKIFNGIIVTGSKMLLKYSNYTDSIFNANEVDLNIFNNPIYNIYNYTLDNKFNIIYCGRISKEKNIDDFLEYCNQLFKTYSLSEYKLDFVFNIIGDGPYLDNIKNIIEIEYKEIKDKFIFHGILSGQDINILYQKLNNRIFLFTSNSETFGKTPIEAIATGIPLFIKKSDITDDIYINKKNAFIFKDKNELIEYFLEFIKMNVLEKQLFITDSINNIKKYDQNIIFNDLIEFLINGKLNKNKSKINFIDIITLFGISKFVNCSGMIVGD
jgi:glycosyltransferase involved in cell wall biosynthesis